MQSSVPREAAAWIGQGKERSRVWERRSLNSNKIFLVFVVNHSDCTRWTGTGRTHLPGLAFSLNPQF